MSHEQDPYLARICKHYERAVEARRRWEPVLQDCYDYVLPARETFFAGKPEGHSFDRLFDSTALVAAAELTSRIQGYLTPVEAKWADLKAGPMVPVPMRAKADGELEDVREYLFAHIHAGNFDQQNHEMLLDVCVGSGTMMIVPGPAWEPLKFEAVPAPQLYLLTGPFGQTMGWFRKRELTIADAVATWPHIEERLTQEQKLAGIEQRPQKHEFVECVVRDWSSHQEAYDHCIFMPQAKQRLYADRYEGWGSNPFITAHWSKVAGHSWGVGPVQLALPDIKTLNMVQELLLQNAEMGIVGMWQGPNDGVLNPDTIQLVPGTVIPHAASSEGLKPLTPPGKIDLAQFVIEKMQANVKKALYDEPLGAIDAPVKSATEIDERMADLSRRIGGVSGRLKTEHSQAIITRCLRILVDQGRIDLPKVDGKIVRVEIVSPLARSQQQEAVIRVTRFIQTYGAAFPQLLPMLLDAVRTGRYLAENIGVPTRIMLTDTERKAQMATAAQAAEGLGAAPTGAADAIRTAVGAP